MNIFTKFKRFFLVVFCLTTMMTQANAQWIFLALNGDACITYGYEYTLPALPFGYSADQQTTLEVGVSLLGLSSGPIASWQPYGGNLSLSIDNQIPPDGLYFLIREKGYIYLTHSVGLQVGSYWGIIYVEGENTNYREITVHLNVIPTSPLEGVVNITGNPVYGSTLTANISGITTPAPLGTLTYYWLRDGEVISGASGANKSTYTLTMDDVGSTIRVMVTASNYMSSLFSDPTSPIANNCGGAGTATSPYLICSAAQLDAVRLALDKHYKLTADIDLTDYISSHYNTKGWVPIGSSSAPFTGSFDGDGHTIKGLRINNTNEQYLGLFGGIQDGEVRNLALENVNVAGNITTTIGNCVGGLVGRSNRGIIQNCWVSGTVSGYDCVGGIVGESSGGNVWNCYSQCNVTGNNPVGGIAGMFWNGGSLANSWTTGAVSGAWNVGGIVGQIGGTTSLANCAALNMSVMVSSAGGSVGRVAGQNNGAIANTIAFNDMLNRDYNSTWNNKGSTNKDGNDINVSYIISNPTLGGRFATGGGWATQTEKLPGLFGKPVDMPVWIMPDPVPSNGIIYVDCTKNGDGSSWANAYPNLAIPLILAAKQHSGAISVPPAEMIQAIYVAQGTYYPMCNAHDYHFENKIFPQTEGKRDNAFVLVPEVKIYGGFAAPLPAAGVVPVFGTAGRNGVTTLSGDIGIVGNNSDNCYHIVIGSNIPANGNTVIDGLTITNGNAGGSGNILVNGVTVARNSGGGMHNVFCAPTLTNLIISGNTSSNGGGMFNSNASPILTHITISGNRANSYGGGIYNWNASPVLDYVVISGNNANIGGGIYCNTNNGSFFTLTNSIVNENHAGDRGGGIYNSSSSPLISFVNIRGNYAHHGGAVYNQASNPKFINVTITGNQSTGYGGGFDNEASSPSFTNATIAGNSSGRGGGFCNATNSNPSFVNSIIWGNKGRVEGDNVHNVSGTPQYSYSIVEGIYASADPQFVNYIHPGSATTNGDYSLKGTSPAIGAGNNDLYLSARGISNFSGEVDLNGNQRLWGANIDMGPYENPVTSITVSANPSGSGTVSGGGDYHEGTPVTVTAVKNPNYKFVNWTIAGTEVSTEAVYTFTVSGSVALVANFVLDVSEVVPDANGIVYVNYTKSGDGSSWTNAYPNLADPLIRAAKQCSGAITVAAADTIRQIWVANGVYKPMYDITDYNMITKNFPTTSGRDNGFVLVKDVKVYGGFTGSETAVSQRPGVSPYAGTGTVIGSSCILSGDIGIAGNISDNSYHVVVSATNVGSACLDGFTITDGNASDGGDVSVNGTTVSRCNGAGIYCNASSPTLANLTITGNNSAQYGGGMFNNNSSSPTLTQITIKENSTGDNGGGIYNLNNSSPTLTQVNISGNSAHSNGGGIYNSNSHPTLTDATISENTTEWNGIVENNGGGMYNDHSSPTLTRVTIIGNIAYGTGGGIYDYYGNYPDRLTLTNCIIKGNKATNNGGGMYFMSNPRLVNVVISGNYANNKGGGIACNNYVSAKFTNVTISGNAAERGGGIYAFDHSFPEFYNSIIWGNKAKPEYYQHNEALLEQFSNPEYSYCVVATGGNSFSLLGIDKGNNLVADPHLVNWVPVNYGQSPTTQGDYRLQSTSPAVNHGDNSLYLDARGISNFIGELDLAGDPRLTNTTIDAGAYEYLPNLFCGGNGSEENPFLICTSEQLDRVRDYLGNHFKLNNDIDLTSYISDKYNANGWLPIGTPSSPFSGSFDGGEHTISGLRINNTTTQYLGLFGGILNCTIENLALANVNVAGNTTDGYGNCVGGLAGQSNRGIILNCWVSGTVSGWNRVGGIVGESTGGSVWNCYSRCNVTGNNPVGGIAGIFLEGGSLSNSWASGVVTGAQNVGGIVGQIGGLSSLANCAALNMIVRNTNPSGNVGRVAGDHNGRITNSIAFDGMLNRDNNTIWNNKGLTNKDGNDINIPYIMSNPTFGGRFTTGGGWATQTGKLPGLFGKPVDLPLWLLQNPVATDGIVYVDCTKSGDGSSWANAYPNLAAPLILAAKQRSGAISVSPAEVIQAIYVAEGTYYPMGDATNYHFGNKIFPITDGGRNNAFVLVPEVKIFGGFVPEEIPAGIVETWHAASLQIGETGRTGTTTLSGNIFGNNFDNCYHVIIGVDIPASTVIDGVFITGGNANGSGNFTVNGIGINRNSGGGIHNINGSSPTINNVIISGNNASSNGGGIFNWNTSAPTLTNVMINSNISGGGGGGMFNNSSSPTLTNVTLNYNSTGGGGGGGIHNNNSSPILTYVSIIGNTASGNGGGMHNEISYPVVTHATISGNNTGNNGGGIYNNTNNDNSLKFTNVIMSGNKAFNYGGGMFNNGGGGSISTPCSPILTNVTMSGNCAANGGGICNNLFTTPTIDNSIIWGNRATTSSNSIYNLGGISVTLTYHNSLVEGISGTGIISSENPQFVNWIDPSANGWNATTEGDYQLQSTSYAINRGSNSLYLAARGISDFTGETDLTGNIRLFDYEIDLGAYENLTRGFCGGDGTEDNPFLICLPEHLDNVRQLLDKHFKLNNDLEIAYYIGFNYTTIGWLPIGSPATPFTGTFDGDGHTIAGLIINNTTTQNLGLFGVIEGSEVRNLALSGVSIAGDILSGYGNNVGGITGLANGSLIQNCWVSGSVIGYNGVGGIVGVSDGGNVANCYTLCDVTGNNPVGGIAGIFRNGGELTNCWAAGSVTGGQNVGGIAGQIGEGCYLLGCAALNVSVRNTYAPGSVGRVAGSDYGTMANNIAFDGMTNRDNNTTWSNKGVTDRDGTDINIFEIWTIPTLGGRFDFPNGWTTQMEKLPGLFGNPVDMPYHLSNVFCGGDGSTGSPFLICVPEQLNYIRYHLDKNYKLANDIDLTEYLAPNGIGYKRWGEEGWKPIGYTNFIDEISKYEPFTGSFNGAGYAISGLMINNAVGDGYGCIGLFGFTEGAKIDSVGIVNCDIKAETMPNVGGLVGHCINTTITKSYATGNIDGGSHTGGLAGVTTASTITNCYATANVSSGYERAGGLVGWSESSTIANCYASGNVTADGYSGFVGGLVGLTSASTVRNCVAANNSVVSTSTNTYSTIYINRITGYTDFPFSTFANNYAFEDMTVLQNTDSPVPITEGLNAISGANRNMAALKSFAFYNTSGNWVGGAWSITNATNSTSIWKICDGLNFPFLQWQQDIDCSKIYTITVTSNPLVGGAVSGGGIYTHGDIVTATATSNPGYYFVDCTIAGAQVSTDEIYDFTATESVTLTANFEFLPPSIFCDDNGIIYVDHTKNGNGSSWTNACSNLSDPLLLAAKQRSGAITVAETDTIRAIYVAEGTYYPMCTASGYHFANKEFPQTNGNRLNAFVLVPDVKIFGGFVPGEIPAGTVETWHAASLQFGETGRTGTTTLSGDIGIENDNSDNCYHVLIGAELPVSTVVDGFTITGGNGSENYLLSYYVNGKEISIYTGCGIYNFGTSSNHSSPTFSHIAVIGNNSNGGGGGIHNEYASPTFVNAVISGNKAYNGGGMYNNYASPTLANVTISGNYAIGIGGGMYNSLYSYPQILNAIIWKNRAATGDNIYNSSAFIVEPVYDHCLVEDVTETGIISNEDPLFVDPIDASLAPTTDGDYSLQATSPAINLGGNDLYLTTLGVSNFTNETDLAGNRRLSGGNIDLGAYEFQVSISITCPTEMYDAVNDITYDVIELVGLCWFTENLRNTKYSDGTEIPLVKLYNDLTQNEINFGLLYTYESAMAVGKGQAFPLQGVCPDGWRIPTSDEWALLDMYEVNDLNNKDFWLKPNNYTNGTEFDMRGAGFYNSVTDRFEDLYRNTAFWSSDEPLTNTCYGAALRYHCNQIEIVEIKKADAVSVRCIQN